MVVYKYRIRTNKQYLCSCVLKAARRASNRAGAVTCEVVIFIRYKYAFHYFTSPRASTLASAYMVAQLTSITNIRKHHEYAFDTKFDVPVY
jgi:hypothetical protein